MNKSKFYLDYIYIIGLLACCYKFTFNIYSYLDISQVDETSYLLNGVNHTLYVEYGPLYSAWYFLLHFFAKNNIHLMFLNFKLLCILFAFATYWYLRTIKTNPTLAFLLSFLMLVCQFNLPLAPKVVIFMDIFQLLILSVAANKSGDQIRDIIIAFLLFISYYIRPEFKISFFIFFVYLIIKYSYQFYKGHKPKLINFFLLLLILTLISILVGFPFKNQSGKSLLAFGQHFSFNYVKWNSLKENPFTNWPYIVEKVFGKVSSPLQALFSNPYMFIRHVATNIRNYIWIFINFIIPVYIPIQFVMQSILSAILFFFFGAGLIGFYFGHYKLQFKKSTILKNIRKWSFLFFIGLLLLIPNIISILLIAPRYHYVALELPVFTTLLVIALNILSVPRSDKMYSKSVFIWAIYFSVLSIFLTPLPAQNKMIAASFSPNHINIQKIEKLNALHLKSNMIYSLNCELIGFSDYKAFNMHFVLKSIGFNNVRKKTPFYKFLGMQKFNLICVDKEISEFRDYKEDMEWQDFLKNFTSLGFVKMQSDSDCYYLVKKELIHNP